MQAWLRAAIQPRMVGIFVLLVVAAGVCIRLGAWQIDRAQEGQRIAQEAAQHNAQHSQAVPIAQVIAPQESMTQMAVSRRVEVTGHFATDAERFWVPERSQGGQLGERAGGLVVALFIEAETEAKVPVIVGFVPSDVVGPEVGQPALGYRGSGEQLTIRGFLVPTEGAKAGGGDGVLPSLSTAQLANVWGTPMYNGFVALTEDQPEPGAVADEATGGLAALEPLAVPQPEAGGVGLSIRNVLYALEWFAFGGFALFLWVRMLRDEVRHLAREAAGAAAGVR